VNGRHRILVIVIRILARPVGPRRAAVMSSRCQRAPRWSSSAFRPRSPAWRPRS